MSNVKRNPATPEGIWEILREVAESQRETDRKFQKTDQIVKESAKETDRRLQETDRIIKESAKEADRRLQETDRIIKESAKEADRRFQETDRTMKGNAREADRRIKYLDTLFTGQWGKLMESLVEGDLVALLQSRGIQVERTARNIKKEIGERRWEIDILAINGDEVVVVEVKTKLNVKIIDDFITFLGDFKELNPEHKDKKVYGAVAYLRADEFSDVHAEKKGLFVIRATGSSAKIINDKNFKAKKF